eukprot:GILK01001189.1.p1 GENE.GILK01001189.1~~GILK01001189.1.p1  ORF type:complete len:360 (+),score=69.70 GILK01001189.1:47-1126(+)
MNFGRVLLFLVALQVLLCSAAVSGTWSHKDDGETQTPHTNAEEPSTGESSADVHTAVHHVTEDGAKMQIHVAVSVNHAPAPAHASTSGSAADSAHDGADALAGKHTTAKDHKKDTPVIRHPTIAQAAAQAAADGDDDSPVGVSSEGAAGPHALADPLEEPPVEEGVSVLVTAAFRSLRDANGCLQLRERSRCGRLHRKRKELVMDSIMFGWPANGVKALDDWPKYRNKEVVYTEFISFIYKLSRNAEALHIPFLTPAIFHFDKGSSNVIESLRDNWSADSHRYAKRTLGYIIKEISKMLFNNRCKRSPLCLWQDVLSAAVQHRLTEDNMQCWEKLSDKRSEQMLMWFIYHYDDLFGNDY